MQYCTNFAICFFGCWARTLWYMTLTFWIYFWNSFGFLSVLYMYARLGPFFNLLQACIEFFFNSKQNGLANIFWKLYSDNICSLNMRKILKLSMEPVFCSSTLAWWAYACLQIERNWSWRALYCSIYSFSFVHFRPVDIGGVLGK